MIAALADLRRDALAEIQSAASRQELDEVYRRYCGKNGVVTMLKREIGRLIAGER